MDDDGGLGIRNWCYFEQPLKNNLGLQLMPSAAERDLKPRLLSNGGFLHRDCSVHEPSIPMEFVRDGWIPHRDNKFLHVLPLSHSYQVLSDSPGGHTLPMLQQPDLPKDSEAPLVEESGVRKDASLKKRNQSRSNSNKAPKTKKPKKVTAPKDEATSCSVPRGKTGKKSTALVINGLDWDISGIPTPVCSCTGNPQQCYRWGVGGWQSACCTTIISMYPLPLSTKRRGARIAGRKMSQGAFKKVLEKLAGEGHNLSNPIDLRPYWAKHGTNKFVTIR